MSKFEYIYKKVAEVIRIFDTRDPFKICDSLDINLYFMDLGNSLKAYFFYQSRIKNIVINSNENEELCRVLCAHELGHALLHGNIAAMRTFHESELYNKTTPAEYEANLFAAELLISDEELLCLLKDMSYSVYDIGQRLSVPCQLLEFKFKILGTKYPDLYLPFTPQADFLKKNLSCVK